MLSLQQLAVYNLIKHAQYDGSDPVVENVIFEVDQLRHKLEEDIEKHNSLKPRHPRIKYNTLNYDTYVDEIGAYLFDHFTYNDSITTDAHLQWKEYFHTLYEFVVIDNREIHAVGSRYHYYNKINRPDMVPDDDVNYHTINYINNLFKSLEAEHKILLEGTSIQDYHDDHLKYGRELFEWIQEKRRMEDILEKYEDIINWSMH